MSDFSRITGLASGMDTENMIKDLMKAEGAKKEKVEAEKQMAEWQQEEYQSISKMLREYRNNYFDVLTPETNFRSPTMFADFTSNVTSSAIEVSGTASLSSRNHTINKITQLATKDQYISTDRAKDSLDGSVEMTEININSIIADIASGNDTFVMNFDGVSKSITLSGDYDNIDDDGTTMSEDLIADLQNQINSAFGSDKINVTLDTNHLKIKAIEFGHQTSVIESDENLLGHLGFQSGESDYLKNSETLVEAFGLDGSLALTINGVSNFGIEATDTIREMMEKVNESSADVTMTYSELSGKFEITANETGRVNKISMTDTSGLLNSLKIDEEGISGYTEAVDAEFEIDDVQTSRANNEFEIDGAIYSLKETSDIAIEVSLSPNTEGLVEKITGFVDKYNTIVQTINEKLDEKRYYDYDPLTDDEKEAMSDDEIELWESKAKSGLLGSSSELEKISTQLRTLIYEPIEGLDISLKDIGIETSSNYKDNGKLLIDKDQLNQSINNNYNKVVELFTKTSDINYKDTTNRSQRSSEEGIANRLYDTLQDAVRNTRNQNGKRGTLIEKAGYEGEISDFDNTIEDKINDYDDRIDDLLDYLSDREDYYYQMFAQMEKAMAQMQSQAGWLSSQLG